MIRSDSLAELNVALSKAQGKFEAVSKTADNPFFKSKYAALPDVVKAASPILSECGLAVWQGADVDEAGELLWTVLLHSSGEYVGSTARLLPVKNDPQAQGSAITYQRRYQYMAALGLVADEDDDGNAASSRASKPSSRSQPRSKPTTQAKPANGQRTAPVASQPTGDGVLKQLRASFDAADAKTQENLPWLLLSVGVESLPENPSQTDIGTAMRSLTLEQAVKLEDLLTGDPAVPGSGESE